MGMRTPRSFRRTQVVSVVAGACLLQLAGCSDGSTARDKANLKALENDPINRFSPSGAEEISYESSSGRAFLDIDGRLHEDASRTGRRSSTKDPDRDSRAAVQALQADSWDVNRASCADPSQGAPSTTSVEGVKQSDGFVGTEEVRSSHGPSQIRVHLQAPFSEPRDGNQGAPSARFGHHRTVRTVARPLGRASARVREVVQPGADSPDPVMVTIATEAVPANRHRPRASLPPTGVPDSASHRVKGPAAGIRRRRCSGCGRCAANDRFGYQVGNVPACARRGEARFRARVV